MSEHDDAKQLANLYTSRNQHSDCRIGRFGATVDEAARAVLERVAQIDTERTP